MHTYIDIDPLGWGHGSVQTVEAFTHKIVRDRQWKKDSDFITVFEIRRDPHVKYCRYIGEEVGRVPVHSDLAEKGLAALIHAVVSSERRHGATVEWDEGSYSIHPIKQEDLAKEIMLEAAFTIDVAFSRYNPQRGGADIYAAEAELAIKKHLGLSCNDVCNIIAKLGSEHETYSDNIISNIRCIANGNAPRRNVGELALEFIHAMRL